jgi:hypothetical protein
MVTRAGRDMFRFSLPGFPRELFSKKRRSRHPVRGAQCKILIACRCFSHVTGFTTSSRSGTTTRTLPVRGRGSESHCAGLYGGFARCFEAEAGCARTFETRIFEARIFETRFLKSESFAGPVPSSWIAARKPVPAPAPWPRNADPAMPAVCRKASAADRPDERWPAPGSFDFRYRSRTSGLGFS